MGLGDPAPRRLTVDVAAAETEETLELRLLAPCIERHNQPTTLTSKRDARTHKEEAPAAMLAEALAIAELALA